MTDELFSLLIVNCQENRTAFLAALIMERCTSLVPEYQRADGGNCTKPRFNAAQAERIARTLVDLAGRLQRYAVTDCNTGLNAQQEARRAATATTFTRLAELLGFDAKTAGDPRGAVARLISRDDPGEGDGWGEGWAVYK